MNVRGHHVPFPVLVVSATLAASLFGDSMLYAVMPSRPSDWGLSVGLVGVLLSANRLVRLLSNTFAAHLFERLGGRLPFAAAMVLAVATTLTYGWATAFWLLLLARLAWGVSWSVLRLGAYWTVLDEATDANRGFLMGIYTAVARTGSVVGVVAGGILADSIGHDWTLTIFAAATALGGLAWYLSTRSQPIRSHAQSASRGNARGGLRLVLRDRRLLMVGLGGLTGMLVFSGLLTASLGFYLRQRYGDEVAVLGTVIGVASFTGIALGARFTIDFFVGPFAGHLSDRRGRMSVTLTAFALGSAGLLLLATTPPLGLVILAVALAFLSSTALVVLLDARAGDLAPPARRTAVMSAYATFLDVGAALGPLVGLSVGTLGALRGAYVGGAVLLLVVAIGYRVLMTGATQRRVEELAPEPAAVPGIRDGRAGLG